MKQNVISAPFDEAFIAAAIAAAPKSPVDDPENPPTSPNDWDRAIISHSYAELKARLAERRRRGPGKAPKKESTTIRFSPDVLAAFRATGKGWQTRMDEALREWLNSRRTA
jgi:uncharacterized protein (DUF4415 family)